MGRSTEDDRDPEATLLRTIEIVFAPLPRRVTLGERLAFGPPVWPAARTLHGPAV